MAEILDDTAINAVELLIMQQQQQSCCSEKKKKLRKGLWSPEEDERLATHIAHFGIAARLPGRSDNEIKNFWNARLRKKLRQTRESSTAAAPGSRRCAEADRRPPATAFNTSPHRSADSAHEYRPSPTPAAHIAAATAVVAEAPAATTTGDAVLIDAGHRDAAAEAAHVHGGDDDGFLAVMVDDEASLLLGEYFLDGGHDGFSFWGGSHVFS
ncbi:hypothetical protein ABZP36_014873 [Zizania latifolia]